MVVTWCIVAFLHSAGLKSAAISSVITYPLPVFQRSFEQQHKQAGHQDEQ